MTASDDWDRQAVVDELEQARAEFHHLLAAATSADLHRPTAGTRWTNEQLLFHMLFGYLITRTLLPLVRAFGRLPERVSRTFAGMLNALTGPFHLINYWGSRGGVRVFGYPRMGRVFDRVVASLQRCLGRESDQTLALRMHFPSHWDPFFHDVMTVGDLYRYPTQHFNFHRQQLTLSRSS
jgi:hypothetical protein